MIPFRRCEISSASHTDSVRLECNFDPWPGELKKDASPKVLLTSGYTAGALTDFLGLVKPFFCEQLAANLRMGKRWRSCRIRTCSKKKGE